MATIAIIQFIAVPGAMAFSWLAYRTSTKTALGVSLLAWIVIVLFGVALAPPYSPPPTPTTISSWTTTAKPNDYRIACRPRRMGRGRTGLQWQGSAWAPTTG